MCVFALAGAGSIGNQLTAPCGTGISGSIQHGNNGGRTSVCAWNLISWSAETESLRSEEFCDFLSVRNEHEAFPY